MSTSMTFGARSTADQVLAGIDLNGKRIIVTGCDSGIGIEIMSALAANGAHVIGLGRTMAVARDACRAVAFNTEPLECDLGDLDSVTRAVAALRHFGQIDAIVANAAVAYLPTLHTRYGVEQQFLVNHVGHFSLINGISDQIRDGSGRVVIVTASASRQASANGIMFDNLAGQRFYEPAAFYAQSKLANALYAMELSRRLRSRGIAVNAVEPGAVRGTRIHRHIPALGRLLRNLVAPFIRSAAQGAATIAYLIGNPATVGVTGEYWRECRRHEANPLLADLDLAGRLWQRSQEILVQDAVQPADRAKELPVKHRAA
ncbi:MAG TPA: SDR family NAD(P)-dependent oxidoreductase [Steroidobacteraceae bacterium]